MHHCGWYHSTSSGTMHHLAPRQAHTSWGERRQPPACHRPAVTSVSSCRIITTALPLAPPDSPSRNLPSVVARNTAQRANSRATPPPRNPCTRTRRRVVAHSSRSSSSSSSSSQERGNSPSSSAQAGMNVSELSVTAELLQRTNSTDEQLVQALAAAADGPADALIKQTWVQRIIAATPDCKLVFSARGTPADKQSLSTGLSGDHLFLSLLQNDMLQDMLVAYVPERRVITVLRLGVPVCGHPTIVHGGLISAVFDEVFGITLYSAGRWGHFDLTMVFTARLEVDYKQPVPAEATIICDAEVESVEGRKIWLRARLTDPCGDTVYASSRALFVKPRDAQPIDRAAALPPAAAAAAAAAAAPAPAPAPAAQ